MRFRICVSAAVGIILIGILSWPIAGPTEPLGAVVAGPIGFGSTLMLCSVAFLAGFIAYFLCWPYGRQLGVLAVPFGLSVWAIRSGNMAALIRSNPSVAGRRELFWILKWEPIFWLAIVGIGFAGVLIGQMMLRPKPGDNKGMKTSTLRHNIYIRAVLAVFISVLTAQVFIKVLAQDINIFDRRLGLVAGQPSTSQVVFAVFVSFCLAGFIVKKFIKVGYIWPIIASSFVTAFVGATYAKENILKHLAEHWPVVFFPNTVLAILPVQMVAFGSIGAIAGFWMAVRFDYWRHHEIG